MKIAVTGGAGFIGSELVRQLTADGYEVAIIDGMTYASNRAALPPDDASTKCRLIELDLADGPRLRSLLLDLRPNRIFHLAAETHVDRSIRSPDDFVRANVIGTFHLLQACRPLAETDASFKLLHVSTDEVYGPTDHPVASDAPYRPSSPYSATKAASDHLVNAWKVTYGIPSVITYSSNNYGPWQFPEKLIPFVIRRALAGEPLPVYGDGQHERDWLHVSDHVHGLRLAMESEKPGPYFFASGCKRTTTSVVRAICGILDELKPRRTGSHEALISHVPDRKGHDRRYTIETSSTRAELGWKPRVRFNEGLRETVEWYLSTMP